MDSETVRPTNAELVHKAFNLAKRVHAKQKYGDQPYMTHVRAVAISVCRASKDPLDWIVAILHDTIENSNGEVTVMDIEREFCSDVAIALDHISWRKDKESYMVYIKRLAPCPRARRVKLCDIALNLKNLLGKPMEHPKRVNIPRYRNALSYLAVYEDQSSRKVAA